MWQVSERYLDRLKLLACLSKKFGSHVDFRIKCGRGSTTWWAPEPLTAMEISMCQKGEDGGPWDSEDASHQLNTARGVSKRRITPYDRKKRASTSSRRSLQADSVVLDVSIWSLQVKVKTFLADESQHPYDLHVDLVKRDQDMTGNTSLGGYKFAEGHTSIVTKVVGLKLSDGVENEHAGFSQMAMKELRPDVKSTGFAREFRNLKTIAAHPHPNFVEVISAFQVQLTGREVSAFLFPLADANLDQLFEGSLPNGSNIVRQSHTLWTQFESLASALKHLHDSCKMAHLDIRPSNILLYHDEKRPFLLAKLADFGRAADLQDVAARFPNSPNLQLSGDETARGRDVWQLGAVFTELLAYLVGGSNGIVRFRSRIFTRTSRMTSDEISVDFLDDGIKAKPEVHDWLHVCSKQGAGAAEIAPIISGMLLEADERLTISQVVQSLRKSSTCLYWDGRRFITFTSDEFVRPRYLDRIKEALENASGCRIDWWPLSEPRRACAASDVRIGWQWCGHSLSADLPHRTALAYRDRCSTISSTSGGGSSNLAGRQTSNTQKAGGLPLAHSMRPTGSQGSPSGTGAPTTQNSAASSQAIPVQFSRTIYWCIDESFAEPLRTLSRSIDASQNKTDPVLLRRLINEYDQTRGWRGRLLSWKSCQDVAFVKFLAVHKGRREVSCLTQELPPQPGDYDFVLTQTEEIHRIIAAKQIVQGMKDPLSIFGEEVHGMIPKHRVLTPRWDKGESAWGIYAVSGFSLFKILRWIGGSLLIGSMFIAIWLSRVDRTDIQGAFVPVTFLLTMITIALGVPQ